MISYWSIDRHGTLDDCLCLSIYTFLFSPNSPTTKRKEPNLHNCLSVAGLTGWVAVTNDSNTWQLLLSNSSVVVENSHQTVIIIVSTSIGGRFIINIILLNVVGQMMRSYDIFYYSTTEEDVCSCCCFCCPASQSEYDKSEQTIQNTFFYTLSSVVIHPQMMTKVVEVGLSTRYIIQTVVVQRNLWYHR